MHAGLPVVRASSTHVHGDVKEPVSRGGVRRGGPAAAEPSIAAMQALFQPDASPPMPKVVDQTLSEDEDDLLGPKRPVGGQASCRSSLLTWAQTEDQSPSQVFGSLLTLGPVSAVLASHAASLRLPSATVRASSAAMNASSVIVTHTRG